MALPSFTITGNLRDILASPTVGGGIAERVWDDAYVILVSNIVKPAVVVWDGIIYPPPPPMKATVDPITGNIEIDDKAVEALANDPGLNVTGIQWRCDIKTSSSTVIASFWFDAPESGETVDLATVVPVPARGTDGITRGLRGWRSRIEPITEGPNIGMYQWYDETGEPFGGPVELYDVISEAAAIASAAAAAPDAVADYVGAQEFAWDDNHDGTGRLSLAGVPFSGVLQPAAQVFSNVAGRPALYVKDFGAIGDGASHPASTWIGGGGYASLAALREDYWTGALIVDDDGFATINPGGVASGTMYLAVGNQWAHITYDVVLETLVIDSSSGGITISTGALTGTSGVDGAITISAENRVIYVENRSGVKAYGKYSKAKTTDEIDLLAVQHALTLATLQSDQEGGSTEVVATAGTYLLNGNPQPYSNTKLTLLGEFKFTGGNNVGQFLSFISTKNFEMHGGVLNANFQGNDNILAFSFFANNLHTLAGPPCDNVSIHGVKIKNARIGGSFLADVNDPANVGIGGGKGITVQYGCKGIRFYDLEVENCDIGFSMEGIETLSGYSEDISLENITFRNCRYIGAFLASTFATPALFGRTTWLTMHNIRFIDCGVGQTSEAIPRDIASLFGVISGKAMVGVKATNIKFLSTTGKMTVFRGSFRHTDWDIQVFAGGELVDLHNSAPYGGWGAPASACRYNTIRAQVNLLNTFSGYFIRSDAEQGALFSEYDIRAIRWDGRSPAEIPEAQYSTGLPTGGTGSEISVLDYSTGRRTRRGNTTLIARDGSNQARIDTGKFVVYNKIQLGDTGNRFIGWGSGTPLGALSADIGSKWFNSDGGAGVTEWVKESGTGTSGWVPVLTSAATEPNLLASGEASLQRDFASVAATLSSGILRLRYFTARKTESVTKVRTYTGNTAAAATPAPPTLCRVGIYSVNTGTGALTLVASIANDTTLWAATQTAYESTLSATWSKVAGTRYAAGLLCVTGATAPTVAAGSISSNPIVGRSPRLAGSVGSQTDLPASLAAGAIADSASSVYVEIIP